MTEKQLESGWYWVRWEREWDWQPVRFIPRWGGGLVAFYSGLQSGKSPDEVFQIGPRIHPPKEP